MKYTVILVSMLSSFTGHFKNERKVRILIGGAQPEDHGVDLCVRWNQHQPHVRGRVETWSSAFDPTANEPPVNPSFKPYSYEGHSGKVTCNFPVSLGGEARAALGIAEGVERVIRKYTKRVTAN